MLIRPRLTDYHGVTLAQGDADFAIPFFDEDIPLYVDPFLMWRSPSQQDIALHGALLNAFNHLGQLALNGGEDEAIKALVAASECDEVGLGSSRTRRGKRIGQAKAQEILAIFRRIPRYATHGLSHIEELQFFVEGISKDRISDFACSFLKSFLIDFTIDQCNRLGIPLEPMTVANVWDPRSRSFIDVATTLPIDPTDNRPLLLVPKRWLRFVPWISYEEYFEKHCPQDEISHEPENLTRVEVLHYNRDNYGVVAAYIESKERAFQDAANDPLFSQIPVRSARGKLAQIKKLATGKTDGADTKYENAVGQLLPSLLYPNLDFAQVQARTDSGVSIRDLIFYNTQRDPFLKQIYADYGSRQVTFEMKNVATIERTHVDQVNRYMAEELGRFGVFVTRHPLKAAMFKRTIDLWSGQRKVIVTLTDADLEQMVEVFDSKQRDPLDVIAKKYAEFRRACP
ncbi:hypothetical protein EH31_10325 [Erythrobacter longus]|uniref:Uncharacterized protein n=1 Tax=Erythrobacter longus TaxID=1044 RepID=A0A074MAP2_ERYLO|nr:hypothetical protein [Erythrobacter longus]KEO90474.1 hypothetical protein EH31_10325 [Erythrobacter longus]